MDSYQDLDIATYQAQFDTVGGDSYRLIDVREADEFEQGHLPNATNMPLSSFEFTAQGIPQDKPIVLVCARGGRSAMAAEFMVSLGYQNVYNLIDGTIGWMMAGLPLEH